MKLSAVILTKNEEKNIVDCIQTLNFCDEIVIVDDDSDDRTVDLLKNLSDNRIKICKRSLGSNFSEQRNFGVSKASNDWIMFVDADERISPELGNEIAEALSLPDFSGYLIPRVDFMWGKELKHGETGSIKLLRLFNKTKGRFKGKVHEVWETKEAVGQLNCPISHYPHPTISEFLREINFYSDLRAEELFEAKNKTNFALVISYPMAKFFVSYLLKLGFLDGLAGFIHAVLMSFYSFLVRGKLWLLWQKNISK